MKLTFLFVISIMFISFAACNNESKQANGQQASATDTTFNYMADRFADIQMLRYRIVGFDNLTLKQKQLAYYLYQAGLCGRDIFYDQKNKHNLRIRKTLECILNTFKGDKNSDDYKKFLTYSEQVFFANGIHHHYASTKIIPEFSFDYFKQLIAQSDQALLPLESPGSTGSYIWNGITYASAGTKMKMEDFENMLKPIMWDPAVEGKEVDLSAGVDVVKASANNFYEGVTQKEVEDFYANMKKNNPTDKSQMGINSKLVKENGKIIEKRWMVGGMYSAAIEKIVYWLEKADAVAENDIQKKTFHLLIDFYKTGKPTIFDDYNISWVSDTSSFVDAVNGFIEVYQDALQKKGSYESIVSMKDVEASKRIAAISNQAQWFEDHSPIMDQHKKKNVKGISAKVITVIGEVGDAAPSTPIGINLPNNEWIRETYGSKSVSLGNIIESYNYARSKSPMIDEFGSSKEVIERARKYGALAADLHTDMHEVIGHASGQINKGVGPTDQTLKNYAGILEEARADLVGLYYIMDPKLIDIGVMPSLEVGKAQYDNYILNGLMTQLYRIKEGDNLEEAHMRNRQLIASWVFEKGAKDKVIEKVVRDGKTYFVINDYDKLRNLFGQLLREIQRIKSEGDFKAGKNLVETYGVKVDQALLKEVHQRYGKLNIAPYMGFIQPKLVPVMNGEEIRDVKVEYPESFLGQMLEYGKDYSYLPVEN